MDTTRLAAAHVPEVVTFVTKPAPSVEMIRRALVSQIPFPGLQWTRCMVSAMSSRLCVELARARA